MENEYIDRLEKCSDRAEFLEIMTEIGADRYVEFYTDTDTIQPMPTRLNKAIHRAGLKFNT